MPRILPAIAIVAIFTSTQFLNAQDMPLSQVLIDGEGWELVSEGHKFTEGPAVDNDGNVFFTDVPGNAIYKIDVKANKVVVFDDNAGKPSGLMFGADGKLYAAQNGAKQIVCYEKDGSQTVLAKNITVNDLVVATNGNIYFTDPRNSRLALLKPDGSVSTVAENLKPNGVILWRNEGTLVTTEATLPHLWTFRVEADGMLSHRQLYYGPLQLPSGEDFPKSDGMTVDDDGRLYLASAAGLQVFDPTGRPCGAIAKPQREFLSNVVFGGPKFDTLYVTCKDKVYKRRVKVTGYPYPLQKTATEKRP